MVVNHAAIHPRCPLCSINSQFPAALRPNTCSVVDPGTNPICGVDVEGPCRIRRLTVVVAVTPLWAGASASATDCGTATAAVSTNTNTSAAIRVAPLNSLIRMMWLL
jgi:hypothetical protein